MQMFVLNTYNVISLSSSFPTEKLGNTVLGSKKDGEFVQFPSFGTFKSKLDGQSNIIAQVCMRCESLCSECICHHLNLHLPQPSSPSVGHILKQSSPI